jgi:DNA-binding PadR family transcriptional regulator
VKRTQRPDARLIYARTPAGDEEIAARVLDLGHATRRILALINARRSVADLSKLARPGELTAVLATLERHELIEVIAHADEASEAQRRARRHAEQARLQEAKAALRNAIVAEFGSAGRIWDARVADSVSLEVLRRVLREAIDVLQARGDEAATQRVLALARPVIARWP